MGGLYGLSIGGRCARFRDVEHIGGDANIAIPDRLACLLQTSGADIGQSQMCAAPGEGLGEGCADPAARAGDHCGQVFEIQSFRHALASNRWTGMICGPRRRARQSVLVAPVCESPHVLSG